MSTGASLKYILLQSWRERWSEARWSIAIQKFVKTHKDRDILAKTLLDQIIIGSTTNFRFLFYLKYSIQTNIITHYTALKCISATKKNLHKPLINLLIQFLESLLTSIGRASFSEDPLQLSEALLSILQWLSHLMARFMSELQNSGGCDENTSVTLELVISNVLYVTNDDSLSVLVYVACKQTCDGIEVDQLDSAYSKLSSSKYSAIRSKCKEAITKLKRIGHIKINNEKAILSRQPLLLHLVACVECLFLNSDISTCVSNYKLIQKLQNLDPLDLYVELIWSGYVGMLESFNTEYEYKWICFLYVKLPNILQKLQSSQHHKENILDQTFQRLICNSRLFDLLDRKYKCNCLMLLLLELKNRSMICDSSRISLQRPDKAPITQELPGNASLTIILKCNEAIHSIIKSLDTDISENLDQIGQTLQNFVSCHLYEYNLLTLISNGLSNRICDHLIKINEYCKDLSRRSDTNQKKCIQMFDLTFMLLCDITQRYKYKPLSGNKECFFMEWSRTYLSQTSSTCRMSRDSSETMVNQIMSHCMEQPTKPLRLTKYSLPKLYASVVQCTKMALDAHICATIDHKNFSKLFECVRISQHSLCLYLTHWLIQYRGPLCPEHQAIVNTAIAILKHPHDIYPTTDINKLKQVIYNKHIDTANKIMDISTSDTMIKEKFADLLKKGTIDSMCMEYFSTLVNLYGTNTCSLLICQEIMQLNGLEELNKGVSIAAAIFHLNINNFSLSLVKYALPKIMMNQKLVTPMSTAICDLIMFCVSIYFNNRKGRRSSKKRSISEVDPDNENEDGSKKHSNSTKNRNRKSEDEISDSFIALFKHFLEILKNNRMSTLVGFIRSFFQTIMSIPNDISSIILKLVPVDLILLLQKYLPNISLQLATCADMHNGRSNRRKIATYVCRYSFYTKQQDLKA